jgi:hypothetical protein
MPRTAYGLWMCIELMEPGKELEVRPTRHLNTFPCNVGRTLRG